MEFGTRTAGEIMTPRVRTLSLEDGDRAIKVIELARSSGHSRFPVLDADDAPDRAADIAAGRTIAIAANAPQ